MSTESDHPDRRVSWKTPVRSIKNLANLDLHTRGRRVLIVCFEDVDRSEKHIFWCSGVVGYRFQDGFNMGRLLNTSMVEDSAWIAEMWREPFRTIDLTSARHYEFSSLDGSLQIVALDVPLYRKCASDDYFPYQLSQDDFGDVPTEHEGEE